MSTGEKNIVWTREAIGAEIILWRNADPAYTLTLIPLALSKGLITEEEAKLAKADLDAYYQDIADREEATEKQRGERLLRVFAALGFSPTKLLRRIIECFPRYVVGNPNDCELRIPHKALIKELKFSTKDYYMYLTLIEGRGFLTHIKGARWKINFSTIEDFVPEEKEEEE